MVYRQDLISWAILSTTPHFPRLPVCLIIQGETPSCSPICPELGTSTELCAEMINNFNHMRHLTDLQTNFNHSITFTEQISLDNAIFSLEHRLSSLRIRKPSGKMHNLDYVLEACRIAALVFLHGTFHGRTLRCPIIRQLRYRLKELLLEKESQVIEEIHPKTQRGYYTWALYMGGINSLEDEDSQFFAERIATSTRVWQVEGFGGWPEILSRIKRVGWTNALQSPECERFGKRVERFIGSGDYSQDLPPEELARACCPVDLDLYAALPTD